MILCPKCNGKMNKVMHFEKDKHSLFFRCSNNKCNFETGGKPLSLNTYFRNKR